MKDALLLLAGLVSGKLAFDADGWITMNGTPVKVDDKGNPVAGPSNVTGNASGGLGAGKSFSDYQKQFGGDHYAAAREFYKKELMGKPVKSNMGALGEKEVHFTSSGMKKIQQNMKNEPTKALLVQHLSSVISDGKYIGETAPYKERSDFVSFHHFQKKVSVEGKTVNVIVDVGRRPDGKYEFSAYNLAHSDSPRFESKKKGLRDSGLVVEDAKKGAASDKGELSQSLEANAFPCKEKVSPSLLRVNRDRIAFDRASQRRFDENGFLHVSMTPISKEAVNDYYGYEIPNWQKHGLDPNRIYKGYRPAAELEKAANTFNGLPLLKEHVKISADDLKEELRAGNLGTSARFVAPYLCNALIIQDAESIDALNPQDDSPPKREISASYRYDPVFKSGVWNGQRFDFVMTNIRGNHAALVEEGRAGPDVVVADENTITKRKKTMGENILTQLKALVEALSGGGATAHPGGEEEAKAFLSGGEADDNDPDTPKPEGAEDDEAEDLGVKLFAYLDNMEDQDLAAKVKEVVEAARASEAPAPVGDEDETAKDEDDPDKKEKDKPAMDRRPGKRGAQKSRSLITPVANINLAMDAKAVAAQLVSSVRAGLRAQIEAAREVRPLVGELDPMAFDSAAGIYQKALGLIGRPTKVNDIRALREMCALARETKRSGSPYPVVSAALANDSKGDADPNFANLGNIRKA